MNDSSKRDFSDEISKMTIEQLIQELDLPMPDESEKANRRAWFERRTEIMFQLAKLNREKYNTLDAIPVTVENNSSEEIGQDEIRLIEDEVVVIDGDNDPVIEPGNGENKIYMGSVSKLVITRIAEEYAKNRSETEIRLPTDIDSIIEVLNRKADSFDDIRNLDTFKVVVDFIHEKLGLNLEQGTVSIVELRNALSEIKKSYSNESLSLPIKDLIFFATKISANRVLNPIKEYIISHLTPPNINGLYDELSRRIKGFGITKTTLNNYHWIQPDPNIGYLSEFSRYQHQLVQSFLKDEDSDFTIKNIINNSEDFKFDFTNSPTGKDLMRLGYRIVEKTGRWQFGVNWGKELLVRGLPLHAAYLSVVTIIPPKRNDIQPDPITVSLDEAYMLTEPTTTVLEEYPVGDEMGNGISNDKYRVNFPNTESDKVNEEGKDYTYMQYIEGVRKTVEPHFRTRLEEVVLSALNNKAA